MHMDYDTGCGVKHTDAYTASLGQATDLSNPSSALNATQENDGNLSVLQIESR